MSAPPETTPSIREVVDRAPALTDAQVEALRALLPPVVEAVPDDA